MTTDTSPAEPTPTEPAEPAPASGPIVARAGRYYRMTRYLMMAILVGYGIWSIHDGFYSWQPQNWKRTHPNEKEKTQADIFFNEALGVLLPPLGIFVLVWALRKSRGEYRLENDVLHVPGHPPVPLDKVTSVDKRLWDRKGIAYVEYEVAATIKATLVLDDFVYEREPTDKIFEQIEAALVKKPVKPTPKPLAAPAPRVKTPPRPKLGQY